VVKGERVRGASSAPDIVAVGQGAQRNETFALAAPPFAPILAFPCHNYDDTPCKKNTIEGKWAPTLPHLRSPE